MSNFKLNFGEYVYLGHPFAAKEYVNSTTVRVLPGEWECEVDLKDNVVNSLSLKNKHFSGDVIYTEDRFLRKTAFFFVADKEFKDGLDEDGFAKIEKASSVLRENPDFKTFYQYTSEILNDPLVDLEEMEVITPELARKYFDYRKQYDDSKYSLKNYNSPYYYTFEKGLSVLVLEKTTWKVTINQDEDFTVVAVSISKED